MYVRIMWWGCGLINLDFIYRKKIEKFWQSLAMSEVSCPLPILWWQMMFLQILKFYHPTSNFFIFLFYPSSWVSLAAYNLKFTVLTTREERKGLKVSSTLPWFWFPSVKEKKSTFWMLGRWIYLYEQEERC